MLDDQARSVPGGDEIYARPEDYDLEHASDAEDARFYGYLLRRLHPVRVLELACGSGRVLASLAATLPSAELTGVDDSAEMLSQARKALATLPSSARDRITLVEGDMRSWASDDAKFDAVLIGCCSVSHLLTMDDRIQTWRRAFDLLKPGGALLVDVAMPDLATLAESQRIAPRAVLQLDVDSARRTRGGAARLLRCTATVYDAHEQRANVRFLYDRFDSAAPGERFVSDFPSHVYFPSEVELLFATTGFEIMQRYGDYAFGPLARSSPFLITLARRPSA